MNNFVTNLIVKTVVKAFENKESISSVCNYLTDIGADEYLCKSDFVRDYLLALTEINNAYNLETTSYAAKVLAKITA